MPLTPAQRSLLARLSAHEKWGQCADRTAATQPARDAFFQRFLDKVDPAITNPADRRKAAESLMRAHFTKLAYRSSVARARGKRRDRPAA